MLNNGTALGTVLKPFCLLHAAMSAAAAAGGNCADLCVQEGNECVTMSATFSQCKPCNAVYEQCGGTIPGTNLPWSEHGRPSCCAGSQASACMFVNSNFYQCKPL
jgi:hypothetical protein